MPEIQIRVDIAARSAYLETYRAESVIKVDERMREVWTKITTFQPWEESILTARAVQAFGYLNDPNAESNLSRYPLVVAGVPHYAMTNAEVAQSYIQYHIDGTAVMNGTYEERKRVLLNVKTADSTAHLDTLVNGFIAATQHIMDW